MTLKLLTSFPVSFHYESSFKIVEILKLEKNSTHDTPQVILDKDKGIFSISGRSMPEDASKFYRPILNWLNNYLKDPNHTTIFNIELEYFNSSSIKQLLSVFQKLQQLSKNGYEVKVIWTYEEDDELIEAKGLEIKSLVELLFVLKPVKSSLL